jgi:hypothetical protein
LAKHVGEIITCNFMHFMCPYWYEGNSKSKVLYFIPTERVSALSWQVCVQLVHMKVVQKVRTFSHTKIFIDNRKETEYASFITHLHLLLHIVTLDTEALVVL